MKKNIRRHQAETWESALNENFEYLCSMNSQTKIYHGYMLYTKKLYLFFLKQGRLKKRLWLFPSIYFQIYIKQKFLKIVEILLVILLVEFLKAWLSIRFNKFSSTTWNLYITTNVKQCSMLCVLLYAFNFCCNLSLILSVITRFYIIVISFFFSFLKPCIYNSSEYKRSMLW